MLNWLSEDSYVEHHFGTTEDTYLKLRLTPKGYSRVDELQKYRASGRNVLVAMKFGDDTKTLREAIREGIRKADYQAMKSNIMNLLRLNCLSTSVTVSLW